jgi:hypothetical protein
MAVEVGAGSELVRVARGTGALDGAWGSSFSQFGASREEEAEGIRAIWVCSVRGRELEGGKGMASRIALMERSSRRDIVNVAWGLYENGSEGLGVRYVL